MHIKYAFHNRFRMIIFHDQKTLSFHFKNADGWFTDGFQHSQEYTCGGFIKKIIQQVFPCDYCKTFKNSYFEEHLRTTASVLIIIKLVIKYWASADLFLKQNVEWFLLRRFVVLVRVYFLLIISRNHSNTFLLIDL